MKERCARAVVPAMLGLAALAAGGCGGSRQDEKEPSGQFSVSVTRASFPAQQSIAQAAKLRIVVHNDDHRTLPNVAVTVETKPMNKNAAPLAFGVASSDTRMADTSTPVWIVDAGPKGGDTAMTNTWALGSMFPGETKTFEWRLTAVRAGTYDIAYRVSPGLFGKATPTRGSKVNGAFRVNISNKPVPARVNDAGQVVRGQRARAAKGQ